MPPTLGNGKICYIEIPAADIRRSSDFYEKVFGWRIRRRGDGTTAFDDTVGEVSGTWSTGRAPAEPGIGSERCRGQVMKIDISDAMTELFAIATKEPTSSTWKQHAFAEVD